MDMDSEIPREAIDSRVPALKCREYDAHKGTFGFVLVVGGSQGMSGAVALAGRAALRGGAGLVRVVVPDVCLEVVASHEAAYMTVPLPSTRAGHFAVDAWRVLRQHTEQATVVVVGPGIGRSAGLDWLVERLYTQVELPMVVDADALNALAARPAALARPGGPRILTPHPGEFRRLTGRMPKEDAERQAAAVQFAGQTDAVVVLKGARTCVSDGRRCYVNTTGNPGMATGGSGDVLAGATAALVAQQYSTYEAAKLAVFLNGLAGDLAAADLGQESLTASDLIGYFPAAFKTWRQSQTAGRG